jgi:hypothetical protein
MKRTLVIIICFLLHSSVIGNPVRTKFHSGDLKKDDLLEIISLASKKKDVVSKGYLGLCKTMMAKYYTSPLKKWKSFNEGKEIIDKAVDGNSKNVELRYIRLMVQLNAPWFLGYNDKVNEDINVFITIGNVTKNWYKIFTNNLLKSKNLNEGIKRKLKKQNATKNNKRDSLSFGLVWI